MRVVDNFKSPATRLPNNAVVLLFAGGSSSRAEPIQNHMVLPPVHKGGIDNPVNGVFFQRTIAAIESQANNALAVLFFQPIAKCLEHVPLVGIKPEIRNLLKRNLKNAGNARRKTVAAKIFEVVLVYGSHFASFWKF